ncbi:hypothetical protein NLG97_g4086 [Lecanicillium saksenae]|uniref:Uncharacterized protein n=1 Tax=Lecanicillium saksenae TaxID=468837 RepID=A0ACC1QXP0_9HYPO|nr:hypothetical protein NLG97_g4086 [Lecanicillium saksenae]
MKSAVNAVSLAALAPLIANVQAVAVASASAAAPLSTAAIGNQAANCDTTKIPACAKSCVDRAALAVGCQDINDWACRCKSVPQIQVKADNCAFDGFLCNAFEVTQLNLELMSICACVGHGDLPGQSSSPTTTPASTPTTTSSPVSTPTTTSNPPPVTTSSPSPPVTTSTPPPPPSSSTPVPPSSSSTPVPPPSSSSSTSVPPPPSSSSTPAPPPVTTHDASSPSCDNQLSASSWAEQQPTTGWW